MPGLLIRELPVDLHRKLQESARRHHRSMTREALALLESALDLAPRPSELPPLLHTGTLLTQEFLERAKRQGRAGRE
jgi:plasmid stability protein